MLQRHMLTSYVPGSGALRSLHRAVLSLLLFVHFSAWARRRPLFMSSMLSAWTAWRCITRGRSLICRDALIDIVRGRRREVMHFQTHSVPLLSMPLVHPHLLRQLVMMELLLKVVVLRLISQGFGLCVSLFCIVSICVGRVFMLFHPHSLAHYGSSYVFDLMCMLYTCVLCMCS